MVWQHSRINPVTIVRSMHGLPAMFAFARATMSRPILAGIILQMFVPRSTTLAADVPALNSQPDSNHASEADKSTPGSPKNVLSTDEWSRVDAAVERALGWLASQQREDGSFATLPTGQPGVTSLCTLAFAAHGHVPGERRYGQCMQRATEFIRNCQKANGLITWLGPDGPRISREGPASIGVPATYNHAISSLTLSELYGMDESTRNKRSETVINNALWATLEMQRWPKPNANDRGGWRYIVIDHDDPDSDLSVTGWQLMFLRSARNAGFNVPKEPIDNAVAYVRRCFSEQYGTFQYAVEPGDHRSRAMAGAGMLALAHAGFHGSREAQLSGDWILAHGFNNYNRFIQFNQGEPHDRYHYSLFTCCQGMYQLGGRHWEQFFPGTVSTLLTNQQADGSWPADTHFSDGQFGNSYTTALVVLALGAPNQFLPVFQR